MTPETPVPAPSTASSGPLTRAAEIRKIAARLFYGQSYNAVGMRMIAEAAGVRPASLYHHFASKEEILYDIVLEVTKDFIDDHLPILARDGEPPDRLARLVELHIEYFWHHRYAMSVGLREMRNLTEEHYAEVREVRLRYQHGIQDFIAEGVGTGHFRCDDPQLVGLALLDMMNGVNGWFSEGGRYSIQDLARSYARLVVHHLLGADTGYRPHATDGHHPAIDAIGTETIDTDRTDDQAEEA